MVLLEFDDLVDLQTRLVLLPRIEEEGVGAVVAAYTPKDAKTATHNEQDESNEKPPPDTGLNDRTNKDRPTDPVEIDVASEASPSKDQGERPRTVDAGESTDKFSEEKQVETIDNEIPSDPEDKAPEDLEVVGMILVGIAPTSSDSVRFVDCGGKHFSSILAAIRAAPPPIVLVFEPTPEEATDDAHHEADSTVRKNPTEESPEDDTSATTSATPDECDVDEPSKRPSTPPRSILGDRLSSWGTRMRATSAIIAAEAASSAASIVTAATEASERAKASRSVEKNPSPKAAPFASEEESRCSLFLQVSCGKFIPLSPPAPVNSTSIPSLARPPNVTTSSVLLVRKSALQACPASGYEFQWYRSYLMSLSDGSVAETNSKDGTEDGKAKDGLQWSLLPGATHATYQPSAADVGHQLRCVTRIAKGDSPEKGEVGLRDDTEGATNEELDETVICSMRDTVAADKSLFNGARQALIRGAQFGNLVGRGNAHGRIFRLHIEVSRSMNDETKSTDVTSALTIFQISGNTPEPLHDEPILRASAVSDPSRPKDFDLIIPAGSSAIVSALSSDGRFQLQAPNRITRESLLLALGIANYKGLPADLNAKTVLYPGLPSIASTEAGDTEETPVKAPIADELQFFTPREASPPTKGSEDAEDASCARIKELERELQRVLSKMARKDKVVSDLQRHLTEADANLEKAESSLSSCQVELERSQKECLSCQSSLRSAERQIEAHRNSIQSLKADYAQHVMSLESRICSQSERIADFEKSVRSLQNEKAVLSAAVEARESKLSKMAELQKAVDNLSAKVSKGDALKSELNDMSQRYIDISQDLEKVSTFEKECREELQQTRATMEDLQSRLAKEQQKGAARQSQLEALQTKTQKLQAERNNYKQKADSLSKEVSRLCRNGRTLRDVEKIVLDEESRQMEVSLLKSQKRQALDDLHHYRTAYEQLRMAQSKAGVDGEAMRALEQKAELERVVSDMTEYVNAKEMQLETLMQVNQALTEELHMLAQANMSKNDI